MTRTASKNRSPAVALVCTVLVLSAALAVPRFFLASDPWFEASQFVRGEYELGDLVVIVPETHLDRLPAFRGLWVVAANQMPSRMLEGFPRVFWVTKMGVTPPADLKVLEEHRFGTVTVQLLGGRRRSS